MGGGLCFFAQCMYVRIKAGSCGNSTLYLTGVGCARVGKHTGKSLKHANVYFNFIIDLFFSLSCCREKEKADDIESNPGSSTREGM